MKTNYFILVLLCLSYNLGSEQALSLAAEKYFQYLDQYPNSLGPLGSYEKGEIEIIRDPKRVEEIERATGRQVGVVAEDRYWIWLNDPIKKLDGKEGVYGRLLWRQSLTGITGVCVMPVLPDGKIALNRIFRHATRSWEYELPRGCINQGESVEAAALREVKEETGMIVGELIFLGKIIPNSGSFNTVDPVFMAKVIRYENAQPEDTEAIASVDAFTLDEIKQGFLNGYLIAKNPSGDKMQVSLKDPFLAFAILQADLRHLFH